MKVQGTVSVGTQAFDYQLHDLGGQHANHLVNPTTSANLDRYHIKVTLKEQSGSAITVFMHPTGLQSDDMDEFITKSLSAALGEFSYERIPSTFDRPDDSNTRKCPWC